MALLNASQRDRIATQFQRRNTEPCPFTKPALKQAVIDCDQWTEDAVFAAVGPVVNSYRQALNATFRTNSTQDQKALLLTMVLDLKFGRLVDKP